VDVGRSVKVLGAPPQSAWGAAGARFILQCRASCKPPPHQHPTATCARRSVSEGAYDPVRRMGSTVLEGTEEGEEAEGAEDVSSVPRGTAGGGGVVGHHQVGEGAGSKVSGWAAARRVGGSG